MPSPMLRGAALAAVVLTASACGASSTSGSGSSGGGSSGASSSGGTSSGGTSSGGGSSGASSSGGSSGSSSSSGSGGSSGGGPLDECAGTSSTARRQMLDIYVMLDRSGSMADPTAGSSTKWQDVTGALSAFVGQPIDGTSVGLQYFGLPRSSADICATCVGVCDRATGTCFGSRTDASSCDAADYARPEVEIGPLAETAPLIRASMARQRPAADTPTSAALQGAIDHARAWASDAANAGHAVLVVFATDGDPTLCDTDLGHIQAIAASGASANPSVRTFVIGVGKLRANLDGIAASGGSGAAYVVDTGADVTAQFLQAMNDIRGKAIGCSYAIPSPPPGQTLDHGLVNVQYQPGSGGAAIAFGMVAGAADCGASAHAWHYDSRAAPTSIVLCPGTCAAVEADATPTVKIVLGCRTNGEW